MQEGKVVSEEAFPIAEKRSFKGKKGKIHRTEQRGEIRKPSQRNTVRKQRETTEWERPETSS